MFRKLVLSFLLVGAATPAMADGWVAAQSPGNGPIAALAGHSVVPIVLVACMSEGVQMSVQLAPGEYLPDPGQKLMISLQSPSDTDQFQKLVLEPMPNRGEYATLLSPEVIAMLAGRDSSLYFSHSIDGGAFYGREEPDLSLAGSSAALKPVLAACNASPAKPAGAQSEQAVRKVVDDYYKSYKLSDRSGSSNLLPFSSGVNALIDNSEMGFLEYDPFCGCQDYDERRFYYAINTVKVAGDRADVVVAVRPVAAEPLSQMTLKLLYQGGKWTVDDIVTDYGSLRSELAE